MEIEKPGNCTILKDKIVICKKGPRSHDNMRGQSGNNINGSANSRVRED